MATPIGTLGTIPTLTIGGRVFTDLTTLIVLGGLVGGANGTTLRTSVATSGYTVTGGTTLTLSAWHLTTKTAALGIIICYTDNDIGSNIGSPTLTNVKYLNSTNTIHMFAGPSALQSVYSNVFFAVPAAKYPGVVGDASYVQGYLTAYGYEA